MRITTNVIYNRNISSLTNVNERISRYSEQVQTGNKFKTSGENPSGMSQKMALTSEIEMFKQYTINAGLLENSLGHAETVIDSINTAMMSGLILIQNSNNSILSKDDRKIIASSLEGLKKQMFDLMNSKDAQGDFIFGGNQSKTQPYIQDLNGRYIFQGDTGKRFIQVSPMISIASNSSGQELFELVETRRTASNITSNIGVEVGEQEQFTRFFNNQYNSSGNNAFTVSTTAGPPDTYNIKDESNNVVQTGEFYIGRRILFNGLNLTLDLPAGSPEQQFRLDPARNDNILNGLDEFITALRDENITSLDFSNKIANISTHMKNARDNMDAGQGDIGARMNTLDKAKNAIDSLNIKNMDARAKVSEVDMYEAISNLSKEDAALSASQITFSKISRLTLFDYIR